MKEFLFRDKTYLIGLFFILVSGSVYFLGLNTTDEGLVLGIFFINWIYTAVSWIYVIISAIFFRKKYRFCYIFPVLVLSLISAYSLNRSMNIFDASPLWFSIVLVIISITCLSLLFFREMPYFLRVLVLAVIGVALVGFLYLLIYLIPTYPISTLLFFLLGISLHSFVPLLFIVFLIVWLCRFVYHDRKALRGLVAGIGFTVILITVFTLRWAHVVNLVNDTYRESFVEDDTMLPTWVRVSQRLPKNNITNKVLKVGLTYVLPDLENMSFMDFSFTSRFTEPKIHDPFIVIASLLAGKPSLEDHDKIKILESIYDSRQQAAERLWSDDGIETTYIHSSILIWPQYRTAYTEQVIMVHNTKSNWRGGEAVYTFHMPEGSVVTSLSLWINGEEEKGILTTKNKADSAYRTIVGVESRDPSLIHWQEGSTVSVRVFPVTSREERTFKIGITSPLHKRGERLLYKPVYFEGTDFTKAKETINVQLFQEPEQLKYPSFLKRTHLGFEAKKKRRYNNQWELSMKDTGLSGEPFCFDNYCYRVQELRVQEVKTNIQDVYLDVNHSWSRKEFDNVLDAVKSRKVWVFNGQEMATVTDENKQQIYEQMEKQQFSLFPIQLIKKTNQSLIVSKSSAVSPNLSDLKGSRFLKSLMGSAHPDRAIFFLDLGEELSPYLKTLRELRLLNYQKGDLISLKKMMEQSVFIQAMAENDNSVTVHDAGISIVKQEEAGQAVAPDHLMRMFAYNHIMLQYADSWNSSSPVTDKMVAEAQQAYVVSPVSSLVVLESQADYDRFDIKDTDNSLKNASKKSKGAVPEPHEWALIIIAGAIAVFVYTRKR